VAEEIRFGLHAASRSRHSGIHPANFSVFSLPSLFYDHLGLILVALQVGKV
jgi:hypothetical protein